MHTRDRTPPLRLLALCAAASLIGCVRYQPLQVSAPMTEARYASVSLEGLTFDAAVIRLVERHPELAALRADAAAVNLRPGPEPLDAMLEVTDGRAGDALVGTDVLSLLGLGPRSAQIALARVLRDEAWLRHHERARELVGQLAEAYAVDHVLRHFEAPSVAIDVAPFQGAQLASESVVAAAGAARAEAAAEGEAIRVALAEARREIAALVGAAPQSTIVPVEAATGWPEIAAPAARDLVYARGDVQRALAELVSADHRFRFAVAKQIPGLRIDLGADIDLKDPMSVFRVSLPLAAPREARAACAAREAARLRYESVVFAALHGAASARNEWSVAEAALRGATERHRAKASLGKAVATRLQADSSAITEAVLVASEEVTAARELRLAAVEAARARVSAARAAGWPSARVVEPRAMDVPPVEISR